MFGIRYCLFGEVGVGRSVYRNDVIVFPERVALWKRRDKEAITPEDIDEVLRYEPELVIFGDGFTKRVEVKAEVRDCLRKRGIRYVIFPTPRASKIYNQYLGTRRVAACLAVT